MSCMAGGRRKWIGSRGGTIAMPTAVRDMEGQIVPLWRVRAGTMLAINGITPVNGTYTTDRNMLFITGTEFDVDTGVLTLMFESFRDTLQGVVSKLQRLRPA